MWANARLIVKAQRPIKAIGKRGGRIVGWDSSGRPIYARRTPDVVKPPRTPANLPLLQSIARVFAEAGGRALLVGGGVRDMFFGSEPKDLDFEIYGLPPSRIREIAQKLGKVDEVGAAFGVLHVTTPSGVGIDVSLPRKDSKVAPGHRGFEVKADPFMTPLEAARRRDFTMNALAYDPLTNEVLNLFGGVDDIKMHTLRITDPVRFADDPLRVLRGVQFVARFELTVPPETKAIMRRLVPQLVEIAPERIAEEFTKLLLKGKKPSLGLRLAQDLGIFKQIVPEIAALEGCEQDPEWHPEGDVFTHTCMVVDEAVKHRNNFSGDEQLALMLAALLHDIGKPATTIRTPEGRIISPGHERVGADMVPAAMEKMGYRDRRLIAMTQALVRWHLKPSLLWEAAQRGDTPKIGVFVRLARDVQPANINLLADLVASDLAGRGAGSSRAAEAYRKLAEVPEWLRTQAAAANALTKPPETLIMGRDLIAAGFIPGPDFGKVIAAAEEARERGLTREEALAIIRSSHSLIDAHWRLLRVGVESKAPTE